MNEPIRKMTIGDRAPNFMLEDLTGSPHELYNTDITGGPIIILVPGQVSSTAIFKQFAEKAEAFNAFGAHRYALLPSGKNISEETGASGFIPLHDPGNAVSHGYLNPSGLTGPAMFALDPNQRIVAIADGSDGAGFANTALTAFARIAPREPSKQVSMQAPVLFIPDVLDSADCDRLIETWQGGDKQKNVINVASGAQTSKTGRSEVKRRSDVIIEGSLERHLLVTLMPRIAPEVERVFSFDKEWGFEKFRVGCYESEDSGFFKAHRDNPSEALSHRHFAASINLNDGYEGGHLRFPEYGIDHYAPTKGGALIFSCGLLHEVVPVTTGHRFTLLTFISTRI
jgi:predicted 2-oxoglutarate/Fe(II)-dependent dioxygenase YbiX